MKLSILDDLEFLKSFDKDNMLKIQTSFPENCKDALRRGKALKTPKRLSISKNVKITYTTPNNIIIAGMGGSAIGGDVLKDWLRDRVRIPIEVSRSYNLPAYANEKTLVVAVSYSGNTEETLSSFLDAIERRCMVVSISSGGLLEDFSKKLQNPFIKLPENLPPRTAFPYLFFPLIEICNKLDVINSNKWEIEETIKMLKNVREELAPETKTSKNTAKQLALALQGHIPIIYGFGYYRGVALRLKEQFNENSKTLSKCECFPELNHNEVVGWTGIKDLGKHFVIILIRDHDEPNVIKNRIDITKKIVLDKKANRVLEIYGKGESKLAKMLSVLYIGDFTSIYLALANRINPTPVEIITKIKSELQKKVKTIENIHQRINNYS